MHLLSKLSSKHKLVFLSIFGAALLIKLVVWYSSDLHQRHFRIPAMFWEGFFLLALIFWNPKGIRLLLLALIGFFITELIVFNFIVGGLSDLPFWYLFQEVYQLFKLDSLYAFLTESILLVSMTLSLFFRKRKIETGLLDDDR